MSPNSNSNIPVASSTIINCSMAEVRLPESKMSVAMVSNGKKRELDRERGSTTSSSSNSNGSGGSAGATAATSNGAATPNGGGSNAASKLSKIGKRLRESCRNLRGKQSRATPEDFTIKSSGNESNRSKHYVAMDFTGKEGRILNDAKGVQGLTTKDGYAYFRRKVTPKEIEPLLSEVQATVHQNMPWFHRGVGRDLAQRILATHAVDGAFLVRDSSVAGGFVISYSFNGRTCHAQVLPDTTLNAMGESHPCGGARVFYSLDEGKTKFFDLLQMVEFYQLNRGILNTRLAHYIVRREVDEVKAKQEQGLTSNGSSEVSMDSPAPNGGSSGSSSSSPTPSETETVTPPPPSSSSSVVPTTTIEPAKDFEKSKRRESVDSNKMDTNHNTNDAKSEDADVTTTTLLSMNGDAVMLSEGD